MELAFNTTLSDPGKQVILTKKRTKKSRRQVLTPWAERNHHSQAEVLMGSSFGMSTCDLDHIRVRCVQERVDRVEVGRRLWWP